MAFLKFQYLFCFCLIRICCSKNSSNKHKKCWLSLNDILKNNYFSLDQRRNWQIFGSVIIMISKWFMMNPGGRRYFSPSPLMMSSGDVDKHSDKWNFNHQNYRNNYKTAKQELSANILAKDKVSNVMASSTEENQLDFFYRIFKVLFNWGFIV